jgi:tetratricopeptide (TPR) repeat protein
MDGADVPPTLQSNLWLGLGRTQLARGLSSEALRSWNRAATIQPATARWQAVAFQDERKYEAAEAIFDLLVRKQPENADYLLDRGILRLLTKRWEEGARDIQSAAHSAPSNVRALYHLGFVLEQEGKLPMALRAYRNAARVNILPTSEDVGENARRCSEMAKDAVLRLNRERG